MSTLILARLRAIWANPTVRAWAFVLVFVLLVGLAGGADRAHP